MKLSSTSQWDRSRVDAFLETTDIPLRLSVIDGEYPFICSLWFQWRAAESMLCCVSHQDSYLIGCLRQNPHCAFEVAPNQPPYMGVRGKGIATLEDGGGAEVLEQLISHFLGNSSQQLANWLRRRAEEETLVLIQPNWTTTWDYSARMEAKS